MKGPYTPLNKLTDKSKDVKLKVRVTQKATPAVSKSNKRYQRLVLRDDEGNSMKATLFENDIRTYEDALQRNGVYELSNVTVKPLAQEFRSKPDEEYQLTLGGKMKLKALNVSGCDENPRYQLLADVPATLRQEESLLDLAAVVIYVGEMREEMQDGYSKPIREMLIADQSMSRPMKLVAKNRFAHDDAASFLTKWHETFQVVGFTAIAPFTYRGLILSTTLSSSYKLEPAGDIPVSVERWMKDNMSLLCDWRAKAMLLYSGDAAKTTTPISAILKKRASAIWQDETFSVEAYLSNITDREIWAYHGCDSCGRKTSIEPGVRFDCRSCGAKNVTVESKLIVTTDLCDGESTLKATIYSSVIERIFSMSAHEYVALRKKGSTVVDAKLLEIGGTKFQFRICPNHELSTANVLKWIVYSAEAAATISVQGGLLHSETNTDAGDIKGKQVSTANVTSVESPIRDSSIGTADGATTTTPLSATIATKDNLVSKQTNVPGGRPSNRKSCSVRLNFNNSSYANIERIEQQTPDKDVLPGESQVDEEEVSAGFDCAD